MPTSGDGLGTRQPEVHDFGMRKALLGFVLTAALTVVPSRDAAAACHAFTVAASPSTVTEGGAVTVTVERDANIGDSRVELSTIDESAVGGSDFAPIRQTINFTTETSRTVQLQTTDDNVAESAETLRLHLSNPGGCAVNPNFQVGPDARVTIADNDAPAATNAPATVTTSARATSTRGTTTTQSTIAPTTTAGALEPEPTTADDPVVIEQAADGGDDGGGAGGALAALGVIAVLGAGGALAYYRIRVARS